jgi:hypothetical protein
VSLPQVIEHVQQKKPVMLNVALSKNPVIYADLLDSGHSFIRAIRDKISAKRSRMATNGNEWQRMTRITRIWLPQNQSDFTEYSDCAR